LVWLAFPAFEDAQKKALMTNGLFSEVVTAVLEFPHSETLAANAVVYFYFMMGELVKGCTAWKVARAVAEQVKCVVMIRCFAISTDLCAVFRY
jgi:hypothetical protein